MLRMFVRKTHGSHRGHTTIQFTTSIMIFMWCDMRHIISDRCSEFHTPLHATRVILFSLSSGRRGASLDHVYDC